MAMKLILINMPLARVELPSLALTQLKARLERCLPGQINIRIVYLNQDFALYMGASLHQRLTELSMNNGIGEWFFRALAFPEQADNTEAFFRRNFPHRNAALSRFKQHVIERRAGLTEFMANLIDRYRLSEADVVGFTSMFSQNLACFALARRLKAINPAVITTIGGANCEYPMGVAIARHVEAIDYVFSGPALRSFVDFMGCLVRGETSACERLDGVFCRANLGQINSPDGIAALGPELPLQDEFIPLDYNDFLDGLEARFPQQQPVPSLTFETSRGCWWGERAHCTFCGLNGMTMAYRAMPAAQALGQFEQLFAYAERGAQLQSVDNILPREYLQSVLPQLRTPATMTIFYEVKADLSEQDIQTLARARVKYIQPGIEALATSTLKLMKKGTTSFHNIRLLRYCAMYDINPAWNLLIGFPGESETVFRKYLRDIPLLTHLPAPIGVAPVRFDRFSPYFTQAEHYGLKLQPFDFYALSYPFPAESLQQLAYYFIDLNFEAPHTAAVARWIGPLQQAIQNWIQLWEGDRPEPKALLYLQQRGGQTLVCDSRFGTLHEYPLDAEELRILQLLDQPQTLARLRAATPDLDPEKALRTLQERQLLFEERERYLSLVLPGRPARREALGVANNPAALV